jgi:CheY-specific phosphatase CheX
MSVKFFGQFLIEEGEVDAADVREALELMERENATIGEIARVQGYMSQEDIERVHGAQRSRDLPFGDLAVEMGLQRQASRRLPIGQALVRLGRLPGDRLALLLDAFKADQAQYDLSDHELPDGLSSHRIARYVIELMPRFLMRVARIDAKLGEIRAFDGMPEFARIRVSIPLAGGRGIDVTLISDLEFGEALASAASGMAASDLDPELVADGVGEFLNVLAGNAASAMTKEGHPVEVGPPDFEALPSHGWSVEMAVGVGRAMVVLSPF